ncbi:MAG TPA: phenylalanine--tRNA ligase subunit beta [Candidatus Saccharimonadales bacterium]
MYDWSDDPAPNGPDELVRRIGVQLAAIEDTEAIGMKYAGIVIVKVISCRKHDNSDHLSVCLIDDGGVSKDLARDDQGRIQVVCGAPNVREGLTVAWLPPGSTVPSSFGHEPFVLSIREIRGETSNGMLASPKELALGDSHDGILEIEEDIAPGTSFADHYRLTDDIVIDMENKMFTHRPDCFGMLGVAREIAGIQGQKFTSPEWYRADAVIEGPDEQAGQLLKVTVRNEVPELVPRFVAVPMDGIKVGPSPVWLQVQLTLFGVRPINNIVDLTNYHMLATGQPLHAYDYDKVVAQDAGESADDSEADGEHGATIVVRQPQDGEKLRLLNGKEIEPRDEAILIASASKAIGLAGVMGGGDTEVDESTTRIILECATFDMYSIRRTSMAHGIFSDAVTRFNKGQSPLQNLAVTKHIVDDIKRLAGGKVAGVVVDDNHLSEEVRSRGSLYPDVVVSSQFITDRLGLELSADEMAELLRNVEFNVDANSDELTIRAPFWRTDIEIPEDIVEEVGRLHGFDQLPLDLPKRSLAPAVPDAQLELKRRLRDLLSRAGANEVLSYSFVHGNLLDKSGQDRKLAFSLSNALSPDLQYYRLSLTPSLLDKVHANIKAGYDTFALFEIGKAHALGETDADGLPLEFDRLACVFAAEQKRAVQVYAGAAFYQARKYLLTVIAGSSGTSLRLAPLTGVKLEGHELTTQMLAPYDTGRSAAVLNGDKLVGVLGEYKTSVQKALKLPKFSAGFEVFLSVLEASEQSPYMVQSRFPKVWQDVCLRVPADVSYQKLHDYAWRQLQDHQPAGTNMVLSPVDIYQRPDDTAHKQFTFRLTIASYDRTLTDGEVATMLDTVTASAATEFGAERV